jgi:hypothetical protein
MDDKDFEDRVRTRAHRLWEQDGRPEGRAEEHWHRAAALVADEQEAGPASEQKAGPAPANPPPARIAGADEIEAAPSAAAEAPAATKGKRGRKKAS